MTTNPIARQLCYTDMVHDFWTGNWVYRIHDCQQANPELASQLHSLFEKTDYYYRLEREGNPRKITLFKHKINMRISSLISQLVKSLNKDSLDYFTLFMSLYSSETHEHHGHWANACYLARQHAYNTTQDFLTLMTKHPPKREGHNELHPDIVDTCGDNNHITINIGVGNEREGMNGETYDSVTQYEWLHKKSEFPDFDRQLVEREGIFPGNDFSVQAVIDYFLVDDTEQLMREMDGLQIVLVKQFLQGADIRRKPVGDIGEAADLWWLESTLHVSTQLYEDVQTYLAAADQYIAASGRDPVLKFGWYDQQGECRGFWQKVYHPHRYAQWPFLSGGMHKLANIGFGDFRTLYDPFLHKIIGDNVPRHRGEGGVAGKVSHLTIAALIVCGSSCRCKISWSAHT